MWDGRSVSILPRATLVLMLIVCGGGCGGGDAPPAPDTASIGTLAYVMTECRDAPAGYFLHQDLRIRRDPVTRVLVFYSSCDPFGTSNHSAGEIFAMRPDGSGLRELTHARGFFRDASDVQHFEQPGPHAYGPYLP